VAGLSLKHGHTRRLPLLDAREFLFLLIAMAFLISRRRAGESSRVEVAFIRANYS
jgi:hypothetical protein